MIFKKQFSNRKTVHISFDNSNGKQQTLKGCHTTQHTTITIFQPNNIRNNDKPFYIEEFNFDNGVVEGEINYGEDKFSKKRESIQSLLEFSDQFAGLLLLTTSLHRDMTWAIVSTTGTD